MRAETVVSITFDDTIGNQYAAREVLRPHGMRATFYVNSPRLGRTGYLSLAQLAALQADGHEIGGHTLSHVDLTTLSPDQQRREICDDRTALLDMGFPATSFSAPLGATDASAKQVAAGCGYQSLRDVGGIDSSVPAETIPPRDAYAIRTPGSVRAQWTLADLQLAVTRAEESGGGWVLVTLHHVCDGCNSYGISSQRLTEFLDWLAPRAANGTVVRTVHEVMARPLPPDPSVDITPPTVSLVAPADGATVSGAVVLDALAADDTAVASVEFLVDGVVVGSGTSSGHRYEAVWDSASVPDRTVSLTARATDLAGNQALTAVRVSIENGGALTDGGARSEAGESQDATVMADAGKQGGQKPAENGGDLTDGGAPNEAGESQDTAVMADAGGEQGGQEPASCGCGAAGERGLSDVLLATVLAAGLLAGEARAASARGQRG